MLSAIPPIWLSAATLATLGVIFTASWIVFHVLVVQSTTSRQDTVLREWARDRGFVLRRYKPDASPAAPIEGAAGEKLAVEASLTCRQTALLRLRSVTLAHEKLPATWNLLVRDIQVAWPPTGLRPVATATSVIDLFSLTSFPLLGSSERFVIYGTGSRAAKALSMSAARGLLPPDIGLLVRDRQLVLDFSARPFDTVEFERMTALAEQIVRYLPHPDS